MTPPPPPLPGPPLGPQWRELPVSRAFFYISLELSFVRLSKSPVNVHPFKFSVWIKIPVSRTFLYISFKVLSKGTPSLRFPS